jgi:acetyltransferase-like isoleucine patch superfamily enzyme
MILRIIYSLIYRAKQVIYSITLYRRFSYFGKKSFIYNPLAIGNPQNIYIGNNVAIQYKVWLAANPQTGCGKSEVIIRDGCRIGNFNHIYATSSIVLENNVLTADKVYISDNLHGYIDIQTPICGQPIKQLDKVIIGEGAWLGENVCIIGASVGKQSVVGANSVVTKSIPDYCVAVGSPAKIIKRYSFEKETWLRTDTKGNFIEA